jgi:hypothetical protein
MVYNQNQEVHCSASPGNGVHPSQPNREGRDQQNKEVHHQASSVPARLQPTSSGDNVLEKFGNQPSGGVGIQPAEFNAAATIHVPPSGTKTRIVSAPPPGSCEAILYQSQHHQNDRGSQGKMGLAGFTQASQGSLSQHSSATTYTSNADERVQTLNHPIMSRLNLNLQRDAVSTPHQLSLSFASITVSDPLLISSSGVSLFGIRQPPHWSYQVLTSFQPSSSGPVGCWVVRRRFRHVVALEERLRQECPGAIFPPR